MTDRPVVTDRHTTSGGLPIHDARTIDDAHDVGGHDDREHPRRDRVRWGPIIAGLVTTLATFVLLQLAFVAMKAVEVDLGGGGDTSFSFWAALSALLAFFLGGVVAGATTRWDRTDDAVLQGVLMWALATVALVLLAGFSASAFAGAIGDFVSAADVRDVAQGPARERAIDAASTRAAQALLSLTLALVASVLGAGLGSTLWPRHRSGGRARR